MLLRSRLDRARHDRCDVPRHTICCLGVGERSQLRTDRSNDEVGQPRGERAREQRFVEPRLEYVLRHRGRVWLRRSGND